MGSGIRLISTRRRKLAELDVKVRVVLFGFACTAGLYGQKHFSWQDACFKNPAAPYCMGHEDAIKRTPPPKPPGPTVVTNPLSSTPRTAKPSLIVVGGVDWRFADPQADTLVGMNVTELLASPLARGLISQLGARQHLTDADLKKIFDGLSGVDQVAVSIRDNRIVVMVTGRVAELALPTSEAGWKTASISAGAMLVGNADAVDQAAHRITMQGSPSGLAQMAGEQQASGEFWAIGPGRLIGQEAVAAGVKRFSVNVSLRDRLASDVAVEFNGVPNPKMLEKWQATPDPATAEGNMIHVRTSVDASEAQQKFGEIAAGPLGEPLGALITSARSLPMRDTTVRKQTKPVIYGLDGGPRVVN